MKKQILFICTHNSARSQMAEGYLRSRYGDRYDAYSAGTEVSRVHPEAIAVMQELGIDISGQRSKALIEFFDSTVDTVITVCDSAHAACPFFPGGKETIHQGFSDPSQTIGSPEEIRQAFRNSRDEITRWIDSTFGNNG
ncbi:MAG TPA: arsenate reductase ArsC [Methanospirillum sp.]|nr:arsenate reductase ArsC [Methanospirillum sp.]